MEKFSQSSSLWILGSFSCSSVSFISIPHCLFPSLTNLPLKMLHLFQFKIQLIQKEGGLLWRENSQRILEGSPGASAGEGCQCSQARQNCAGSILKPEESPAGYFSAFPGDAPLQPCEMLLLITLRLYGDRWCLDKPALLLFRFKGKKYT